MTVTAETLPDSPGFMLHGSEMKKQQRSPSEEKRQKRKKKSPINFRLNKSLVRAETTEEVLVVVSDSIQDFNIVNIGTALYRLALVGGSSSPSARDNLRGDERFILLITEIIETLQSDTTSDSLQHLTIAPKELSNLIWAATKLGLSDPVLFEAVSRHVIRHMELFDSVNLSLTLWGFAKMNQNSVEMFQAAIPRVKELLHSIEPHRMCNLVWAYAKTSNVDLELFRLIAEEALRKLHRFNHSNESMLLYSYALAHVHAPMLFKKAMSQQLPAIKSGEVEDPRSLSNLLWAISELNLHDEFRVLYEEVAKSCTSNIHRYSLTHMATIASAYSKANIRNDELFQLMANECMNRPVDEPGLWPDLVILNDAFENFQMDSGIVRETINRAGQEEEILKEQERQAKVKTLVTDLVGTSAIAAIVLIIAALLRQYLS